MVVAIEEQALALSGIDVEFIIGDLQYWSIAYKEDKSCVATYSKL